MDQNGNILAHQNGDISSQRSNIFQTLKSFCRGTTGSFMPLM